jgi:transcriptional regulator with XRE-family HTH domain
MAKIQGWHGFKEPNMTTKDPRSRAPFARRLRALRQAMALQKGLKASHYTQAAMAADLGLLDERYRRYERGEADPSLEVLRTIRRVTGVSLDVLVAGELPGSASIISLDGMNEREVTLGDRLRWAREAVLSDIAEAADLMRTDALTWERYEQSLDRPSVTLMSDFARRCGVSLDYLYRGLLTGMAPEVWEAILIRHPELRPQEPAEPTSESTARPRRRKAHGGGRPSQSTRVSVLPGGKE